MQSRAEVVAGNAFAFMKKRVLAAGCSKEEHMRILAFGISLLFGVLPPLLAQSDGPAPDAAELSTAEAPDPKGGETTDVNVAATPDSKGTGRMVEVLLETVVTFNKNYSIH